jgi:hypothetical protein
MTQKGGMISVYRDLNEISDGKIYGVNDMAKVACADCAGCYSCCEGMGSSIILDPYDTYLLTKGTGKTMEELLCGEVELHVADGVILPNLKMQQTKNGETCGFLNEEGRCSIHPFRPGLCRVFPLGRIYEENGVSYFLQTGACAKGTGSKIKVSKWLDIPEVKKNHAFLIQWHALRKCMEKAVASDLENTASASAANTSAKQLNLLCLNLFYLKPYDGEKDFYEQFAERLSQFQNVLNCKE